MDSRVAVAVALLVTTAGLAVAGPVAGAGTAQETPTETPTENATNGSDAAFGAAVSSFMQASAAEAEGEVDNGMWVASYARANSSERPALVEQRTDVLERRLARLEAERAALLNGTDGQVTVQERARAARLAARIDALRDAINATADAAEETGVNRTRLAALRNRSSGLAGPEVARMARNLTFGPPAGANGGPGAAQGTDGPPGNSSGGEVTDRNASGANATDRNRTQERGGGASDAGGEGDQNQTAGSGNDGESGPDTADESDGR